MKVIIIGSVIHAALNAAMSALAAAAVVEWDGADDAYREKVVGAVQFAIDNPDITPEQQHEQWREARIAEGWTLAEAHDAEKKQSPLLVPYADLSPEQRTKDALVHRLVLVLKDIPDAGDAVEAFRANLPPPVERAVPTGELAAIALGIGVGVKYIGRRPDWSDRMYGTGLVFVTDQVRALPEAIARKLLRHADLFERADVEAVLAMGTDTIGSDADTAKLLEQGKQQQQRQERDLNQIQDMYDQIDRMDKAGLVEFAKVNYRQDLPKNATKDVLRAQVKGFVDQFGVV